MRNPQKSISSDKLWHILKSLFVFQSTFVTFISTHFLIRIFNFEMLWIPKLEEMFTHRISRIVYVNQITNQRPVYINFTIMELNIDEMILNSFIFK